MIIVTGASGLLGSNFLMEAQQKKKDIIAVYNRNPVCFPSVESVQADMTDKDKINKLVESVKPEWIVHCAALTNVEWCEQNPQETFEVNAFMPRNLAKAAEKIGAGIIYISTDSIFSGIRGNYSEDDAPGPINVYAKSKLAGEIAVKEECGSSLIIRTNIFGWNASKKLSLAEWILFELESNRTIDGFTDVIFSPILVNELSRIILKAMESKLRGTYNIACSQSCSKYEFARRVARIFDLDEKLIMPSLIKDSRLKAFRPKNVGLNTKKICKKLNIEMPDLNTGIIEFKALRDFGFVNKLKAARRDKYA